jgi:hypothetical protein
MPLGFMLRGSLTAGRPWLLYGFLFVCFWVFVEFFGRNFFHVNLDSLIPRKYLTEYNSTALGDFYRARGPVEESGHLALYIVLIGGVLFSEVKGVYSNLVVFFTVFVALASLVFTFSVASFIELPVAVFVALIVFNFKNTMSYIFNRPILAILIMCSVLVGAWFAADFLYELIFMKLDSSSSLIDRQVRFHETFYFITNAGFLNILIGFGPGSAREFDLELVLSAYVLIFVDYGLLGLMLFVGIFLQSLLEIRKIQNYTKRFLLAVALISLMIHFFIIPNYWYPWPWFLLAYIRYSAIDASPLGRT